MSVAEKAIGLYDPYKYYNYMIGYNSRLDAIQASILSIKVNHIDEYNTNRSRIASQYNKRLTDKVLRPIYDKHIKSCWHQYAIRSDYKQELCSFLSDNGIGNASFYAIPLHRQKAFNSTNSRIAEHELSAADMISNQTVCLPIFPEMTDEQINLVIEFVNRFYEEKRI